MILVDFAPVLPEFFSLGLVGVGLVSWLGDDGSDEVDQETESEDDFDMGDDDDFGEMDDFDDDFGGMDGMDEGGGGASSTELENRIEDLESEVANVSSTANTVRSENEQISEKVEDVEENVRKLLEIYEMVTRGVNPFVDDVGAEAGMGGGGADFGLFGEEEEDSGADEDEDLGSDIADAEAEDFFEDDAFEDDFGDEESFDPEDDNLDEEFGDDEDLGGGELNDEAFDGEEMADGEFDDFEEEESANGDELLDDASDMTDTGEDSSGGSDGGTSFEELKAEYESGDAEWAEDEELDEPATEAESTDAASEPTAEPDDQPDLFHQDDLEGETESAAAETSSEEPTGTEATGDQAETTPDSTAEPGMESPGSTVAETTAETNSTSDSTADDAPNSGFQFGAATAAESADQPHLDAPPNGYLSDVLIMEWLDFLVGEFDARNAIRAINHYERIDWIGESMRDHCYEVLQGIADGEYPYRDESGPTELTMEDHRRSLRYIENLATGHLDKELGDRLTSLKTDGVQR